MSLSEYFPVAPGVRMNIVKARKLLKKRLPPPFLLKVKWAAKIVKEGEAGVNKKHVERGQLSEEPVIVMRIAGRLVLIDGWHRCMRAYAKRQKFILARELTEEEAVLCAESSIRRK